MNGTRFDHLTRLLNEAHSRRGVATLLACGALGAALTRLGLSDAAAARCARVGDRCKMKTGCCRGAICKRRRCRCDKKGGFQDCDGDGGCENLLTDEDHCGRCDRRCSGDNTCCDGACVDLQSDEVNCGACGQACPDLNTCCDGACADLLFDPNNCGECGRRCSSGEDCLLGNCLDI